MRPQRPACWQSYSVRVQGKHLLLVERGRGITCKNKREGREEEGQSIS